MTGLLIFIAIIALAFVAGAMRVSSDAERAALELERLLKKAPPSHGSTASRERQSRS